MTRCHADVTTRPLRRDGSLSQARHCCARILNRGRVATVLDADIGLVDALKIIVVDGVFETRVFVIETLPTLRCMCESF